MWTPLNHIHLLESNGSWLQVINAEDFWLIDGNLHLWLDKGSNQTSGALISSNIRRNVTINVQEDVQKNLDAVIQVKASRSVHAEGYVNTSAGRIINSYSYKLDYENSLYFGNDTNNSKFLLALSVKGVV